MDKRELTKLFLEKAGLDTSPEYVKTRLLEWWVAPLSPRGLHLSKAGVEFVDEVLQLEKYTYVIKKDCPRTLQTISRMNKFLSAPFYWKGQKLIVYGETDAVMLGIMGGDLQQYLENFTRE